MQFYSIIFIFAIVFVKKMPNLFDNLFLLFIFAN